MFPASGPLRGTAGQDGSIHPALSLTRRGAPFGAAGVHHNRGYGGINPHHQFRNETIFMGNHLRFNDAHKASPRRWGTPRSDIDILPVNLTRQIVTCPRPHRGQG